MIKIGAGKYRSRTIETPTEGTLPTKNRVREAMMSMVTSYLPSANVLDLFAGSGALGIEALSRGAKKATFVDSSSDAIKVIRGNLALLKEINGTVIHSEFLPALQSFSEKFDLVFLDPPYAMKDAYGTAIDTLLGRDLLSKDCAIIVEYEGDLELDASKFQSRRDYRYGKTKVILLRDLL